MTGDSLENGYDRDHRKSKWFDKQPFVKEWSELAYERCSSAGGSLQGCGKPWARSSVPQEKKSRVKERVEPKENLPVDCMIRVRKGRLYIIIAAKPG